MRTLLKYKSCKKCGDLYCLNHTATEMYANMGVCSNACGARVIEDQLRKICPDFDVPSNLD
jgi:hypothetical protein